LVIRHGQVFAGRLRGRLRDGPVFKVELEIAHQQNIIHAIEIARTETTQE